MKMSDIDISFQQGNQLNQYGLMNENLSQSSFSSQSTDSIESLTIWNFNYGNFQRQRLTPILKDIQEVFVQQAHLGTNQNEKIPVTISHINFPFLKLLNLQTNHIKSIQIFQFLKVPQMKELILKNNNISSLRVFKKLNWQNIQTIDLQKNLVTDLDPATFGSFRKLKKLLLETENDHKICQNLTNLTKLSSQNLSYLKCTSHKRIIDEKIFTLMKKKFERRNFGELDPNIPENQLMVIQRKKYN